MALAQLGFGMLVAISTIAGKFIFLLFVTLADEE